MFANQRIGRLLAILFAVANLAAASAASGATRTEGFSGMGPTWRDGAPRAHTLQRESSDRGSLRTPLRVPSRRVLVRDLAFASSQVAEFTCEPFELDAHAAGARTDSEAAYSVLGRAPPSAFLS